ncbi:MAG: helix-turn-helix transcriptional regulator [Deinococcales bacterium]
MSEIIPFHQIYTSKEHIALEVGQYSQRGLEPLLNAGPHRHNMHEILVVTQGEAEHSVDEKRYWIEKSSLCLIAKGQVHDFHHFENFKMWGVFFLEDMLDEALIPRILSLFSLQVIQHFSLDRTSFDILLNIMQAIKKLLKDQDGYSKEIMLKHYLSLLILQIDKFKRQNYQEHHPKQGAAEYYDIAQALLALLASYAQKERSVDFYAKQLNLSSRKLSQITQEVLGKKSKLLIEEHLNLKAKRLLRFSHLNMQSIAYELGFDDPAYFARFFKKHNGIAPSEYR